MRDDLISAAITLAFIVGSVVIGSLPFLGHHQVFVGEVAKVSSPG